jgi:DNA polymerase-3 subunit gamma/tau
LATTEKHKIIPTILSRCQIFDFKRITVKDAAEYLKYIAENQGIDAEEDALHIIAQKADGAMRDALSIFDRVVSFSGAALTRKAVTENLNVLDYETYFETTDLILNHAIPQLLILFNKTLSLGFDGHHFISGLASHFRDLMVCQHQDTIELLEVGEAAKKNYLEQSKKTSANFLMTALEIANDCDLKYKASKNQRLLVELTLMKLASIDFDGEKKNPESVAFHNQTTDFIAPAAFYKNAPDKIDTSSEASESVSESASEINSVPEQRAEKFKKIAEQHAPIVEERQEGKETVKQETALSVGFASEPVNKSKNTTTTETAIVREALAEPKINISAPSKRVSGLSISSLKAKKEHELNKIEVVLNEEDLPKDEFDEEALQTHWSDFVKQIDDKGQKILASNLNTDIPQLKENFTICIELPNGTMKKEIERESFELMEYLRTKLNNHFIQLKISVNEESAKKFAFTPEEKYEKLREKNPAIDLLRKEFDLDL